MCACSVKLLTIPAQCAGMVDVTQSYPIPAHCAGIGEGAGIHHTGTLLARYGDRGCQLGTLGELTRVLIPRGGTDRAHSMPGIGEGDPCPVEIGQPCAPLS